MMKTEMMFLLLLGLLAGKPALAQNRIQPVRGTFLVMAYQDERNKYMYPQGFDNTDPAMWKDKVKELHKMGMEYLIFQQIANDGKAFYPSKIMARDYPSDRQSPVDAVMEEAGTLGMKVFMSIGWAKDQLDDLGKPETRSRYMEILTELAGIYGKDKALYGWYLPVEACIGPVLPDFAVKAVNEFVDKAQSLTPGKKTMISPFGIFWSDFNDKRYEAAISGLKVDIIAYQDEVGCVREPLPIPRLRESWKKLREIHDRNGIEMWANCESFTWEKGTNNWYSALIPAAFPRFLSQLAMASETPVDMIISFNMLGIYDDPRSKYSLGQPYWSGKAFNDYMAWMKGDKYWNLCSDAFMHRLLNKADPSMGQGRQKALLDGKLAQEDTSDANWVKFDPGHHEVIIDMKKESAVREVFIRALDYHLLNIGMPVKIYLYTSADARNYRLSAIKNGPAFPNDKHDAWIEGIHFSKLNIRTRYLKVAFSCIQPTYLDEIFINPEKKRG